MLINLHLDRWTNDDRPEIVYVDQLTLAILRANLRLGGGTQNSGGELWDRCGSSSAHQHQRGIRKVFLVEGAIRGEMWGLLWTICWSDNASW